MEAERRREAELAKVRAQVIAGGPIRPEQKMKMSMDALDQAYASIIPWRRDKRSEEQKMMDDDKNLEDFYYRTIEAHRKMKAMRKEQENATTE